MKTILLMATTLDGKIARDSSHLVDWTGKEDKQLFIKLTKDAGVVIMGSKTYDTFASPLPKRMNIVMTKNKSRLKKTASSDKNLIFSDDTPENLIKDLESKGFNKIVLIGGSQINSLFLKAQLINEIYLTIVPEIFGSGLSMFDKTTDTKLELISSHQMADSHILLKYKILY